jgi:hypothetical protein
MKTILWRRSGAGNWFFSRVQGLIDGAITSLTFDHEGSLWIGNSICINKQYSDLAFERVGSYHGLPVGNITSLATDKLGAIWMGTLQGGVRFFKGSWKYYYGPRWLPSKDFTGQSIISIAVSAKEESSIGLFVTEYGKICYIPQSHLIVGLSLIRFEEWTLEQKAKYYQTLVFPRHFRYGLVSSVSEGSMKSHSS